MAAPLEVDETPVPTAVPVDIEPLEHCVHDRPDVLGSAVEAAPRAVAARREQHANRQVCDRTYCFSSSVRTLAITRPGSDSGIMCPLCCATMSVPLSTELASNSCEARNARLSRGSGHHGLPAVMTITGMVGGIRAAATMSTVLAKLRS